MMRPGAKGYRNVVKKLGPMGGAIDEQGTNFDWPTQEIVADFSSDVSIKSLTCGLSNGDSVAFNWSLTNERGASQLFPPPADRIEFDTNKKIRKIKAFFDCDADVRQIQFLDEAGEVIEQVGNKHDSNKEDCCEIAENQTLVGFYGKIRDNCLNVFGAVVMEQEEL